MSDQQASMFNDYENSWEKEWHDMPEFAQENQEPSQQIIISFESFEDVKAFSELVGQKLTPNTKSLWFPQKNKVPPRFFQYVDESK